MPWKTLKLVITGDNKSAVRAIEDTSAASGRAARKVADDNRKMSSSFGGVHDSAGRVHDRVGMLGGAVGLGGLAFGIKDVVSAGMTWQTQQAALQTALRNTHTGGARTADMLSNVAEKGSMTGGFAAPQELASLTQFTTLTRSASQATKLNAAAMNLARGTGLGYTQTSRMMGQVLTGNVGRLQRYLGIIQPVKTHVQALTATHKLNIFQLELQAKTMGKLGPLWLKQKELLAGINPLQLAQAQLADKQATAQMVLARIQQRYGGQTAAYSRTAAGQMNNLRNTVEVLSAKLGTALLPAMKSVINATLTTVKWMERHKTLVLAVVGVIGGLTVVTYAVSAATAAWEAITAAATATMAVGSGALAVYRTAVMVLGLAFEGMGVAAGAAWVLATGGIILLIAGITLIITHFKQFKQIVADVWSWMKQAAADVVNWVGQHWQLLAGILLAPFAPFVAAGLFAFKIIKGAIEAVPGFFKGAFDLVKGVVKPVIDWLIGAIKWIVDKVLWLPRELAKLNPFGSSPSTHTLHHAAVQRGFGTGRAGNAGAVGRSAYTPPATRSTGTGNQNSVNAHAHPASAHVTGGRDQVIELHHQTVLGSRVVTEEVARYALRRTALS